MSLVSIVAVIGVVVPDFFPLTGVETGVSFAVGATVVPTTLVLGCGVVEVAAPVLFTGLGAAFACCAAKVCNCCWALSVNKFTLTSKVGAGIDLTDAAT